MAQLPQKKLSVERLDAAKDVDLTVEKVAVDKVDISEIAEKVVIEKQASQTAKSFVSQYYVSD